jgi:hypothetical protein
MFLFELIIYISTVAKGPEIVLRRERVESVHRQALLMCKSIILNLFIIYRSIIYVL